MDDEISATLSAFRPGGIAARDYGAIDNPCAVREGHGKVDPLKLFKRFLTHLRIR
jgi:hypothetical protein